MRSQPDRRQHLGKVVPDRPIWESDHPISCHREYRLPFGIPFLLLRMDFTVKLNHKAPISAAEVDDERTDRMLSAELHPIQATPAQRIPQEILNPRLVGSQIPRCRDVVSVLVASPSHD